MNVYQTFSRLLTTRHPRWSLAGEETPCVMLLVREDLTLESALPCGARVCVRVEPMKQRKDTSPDNANLMCWCDITQNGDVRGRKFVGEGGRDVHMLCTTWTRAELVLVAGADPSGRSFVAAKEYADDDGDVECIFS